MGILLRNLQRAGEYSWTLVIPKEWLQQVGYPKSVRIMVGRKRLIIHAGNSEKGNNGKRQ